MKNLKKILFGGALAMATLTLVMTSCSKDECEDVSCGANGTCDNGVCICEAGYEGGSCETLAFAKFLGSWTTSEQKNGGTASFSYTTVIAPISTENITEVTISEIADELYTNEVRAYLDGNNLVIPSQDPDGDGFLLEGNLSYNNSQITAVYEVNDTATGGDGITTYEGTWIQ